MRHRSRIPRPASLSSVSNLSNELVEVDEGSSSKFRRREKIKERAKYEKDISLNRISSSVSPHADLLSVSFSEPMNSERPLKSNFRLDDVDSYQNRWSERSLDEDFSLAFNSALGFSFYDPSQPHYEAYRNAVSGIPRPNMFLLCSREISPPRAYLQFEENTDIVSPIESGLLNKVPTFYSFSLI